MQIQVFTDKETFLQVGETNKYRRWLKQEKLDARIAIYPMLQAEEDRR